MDRDLLTRAALCCLLVAAVVVAAQTGRYLNVVAPVAVVGVAAVMFWPRRTDGSQHSPSDSTDRA